jgi:tRNA modification GTPase
VTLDSFTETISAIATPVGVGGIAVIRMSGPMAATIVLKTTTLKTLVPNSIHLSRVNDQTGQMIDEALIAWFAGPNSYTGEDVAEIHCHGGVVIARQILARLFQLGSRLAQPGEFTQRAFIHGKMDLIKAEAIIDLIEAKTEKATAVQVRHLFGDLSQAINALRAELLALVSHLEVHLDYPDEEILFPASSYATQLQQLEGNMEHLLASFKTGRILQEGLMLVIVGKPNVGKSSLLNTLIKEHRVLVSDQPGTTRDAIEVWMKIAEVPIKIVDTAGLHETSDTIEQMGMERTMDYLEKADLVLFVVDRGTGITDEDREIMGMLSSEKTLMVINKIDQKQHPPSDDILFSPAVHVSAKTEQGMSALWSQLEHSVLLRVGQADLSRPVLTNERQKEQLIRAKLHVEEALQSMREGLSEDFWLIGLRAALRDLSEILGLDISAEVLSNIFSRFCVGK